jgi:hypothetical protein
MKPPISVMQISNGWLVTSVNLSNIIQTPQGPQPEQITIYCAHYQDVCEAIKSFWPVEIK